MKKVRSERRWWRQGLRFLFVTLWRTGTTTTYVFPMMMIIGHTHPTFAGNKRDVRNCEKSSFEQFFAMNFSFFSTVEKFCEVRLAGTL